ncbi:hypothetical protein CSPX01_15249, partial [Colletotrichum filicis]
MFTGILTKVYGWSGCSGISSAKPASSGEWPSRLHWQRVPHV